ncbi:MAG: YheT family hydrolase, partial [Gammaproteobacteria bacterium]
MPSAFKAAWWLPGGHAQTLWPALMRRRMSLQLDRERLLLSDGDFLDLAWAGNNDGAIVILLHGLEGSLHSHYAMGMLNALCRQGFRPVFMHFRGCSGTPNLKARGYHSGETGDLRQVIGILRTRYPGQKLAAVGFSLGGNVLLKYLGEEKSACMFSAAVCISVPFELSRSANRLNQGFSKLYQWHLLR